MMGGRSRVGRGILEHLAGVAEAGGVTVQRNFVLIFLLLTVEVIHGSACI